MEISRRYERAMGLFNAISDYLEVSIRAQFGVVRFVNLQTELDNYTREYVFAVGVDLYTGENLRRYFRVAEERTQNTSFMREEFLDEIRQPLYAELNEISYREGARIGGLTEQQIEEIRQSIRQRRLDQHNARRGEAIRRLGDAVALPAQEAARALTAFGNAARGAMTLPPNLLRRGPVHEPEQEPVTTRTLRERGTTKPAKLKSQQRVLREKN